MVKKKAQNGKPHSSTQPSSSKSSASATAPAVQQPKDEVEALEAKATAAVLKLEPITAVPTENLDELKRRAAGVIATYNQALIALEAKESEALAAMERAESDGKQNATEKARLAREQAALEERKRNLEAEQKSFGDERSKAQRETKDLTAKVAVVQDREEQLKRREADADAGFVERREATLAELNRAHKKLMADNELLAKELEAARQAHTNDWLAREKVHREKLATTWALREQELEQSDAALSARETEAKRALQHATRLREDADALKRDLGELIEERANDRVASARQRAHEARERCVELERQLDARSTAERAFANETPEQTRARLDQLGARVRELETDLSNRPSALDTTELQDLRNERERWQADGRTLRNELAQTRRQLDTRNIAVDEVEILRDRNEALKENQKLLKAALDDLRKDVDERLDKHRDQPVFPEFLRMDQDLELAAKTPIFYTPTGTGLDLREFSADLRHRMGRPSSKGDQPDLFFRDEEVRAFLGGLAMSRLHLLQGISGIGKSSLPRRFAEAVGGLCETISVQAGWRDRNDLLGYYNAFERRYHESDFVQAVYKAQTPKYQDRIALVLLDEMNLSHPEQYGADVLDVLARDKKSERRFPLLTSSQGGSVPSLVVEGRFLPLPDNVWFVGTANHDETTKDFADKTYDRSFVLELPGEPTRFDLKAQPVRQPVRFRDLLAAFEAARKKHEKAADEGLSWMNKQLRADLIARFGVSWGGRLEEQARKFITVVLACDGTLGEAVDQLVTTRILRRIKGRHDLMDDDVRHLRKVLDTNWVDKKAPATKALSLLDQELKRLGAEK